jgi:molybdate transport system substrate-binding protein
MSTNTLTLHGISSKATQSLLAVLTSQYAKQSGVTVNIESVGGVDAAKRVQAAEPFDLVFLASDAIDKLMAAEHVVPGSRCDWVNSSVAVAVRSGLPMPRMGTEKELQDAIQSAASLCYSTGPSGTYLVSVFKRWGMFEALEPRLLVAPPGIPVARLLAEGKADLGFQQRSELIHQPGIQVIGDLPEPVAYITTFSACIGLAAASDPKRKQAVGDFLEFLRAPEHNGLKQSHGMMPL